jgi:hypothetical protein
VPAIFYRAVSKHTEHGLRRWLGEQDLARALPVFVGASSREKAVATSLSRAYDLRTEVRPDLPLGGVAIPARHARGDEDLRLIAKQAAAAPSLSPRSSTTSTLRWARSGLRSLDWRNPPVATSSSGPAIVAEGAYSQVDPAEPWSASTRILRESGAQSIEFFCAGAADKGTGCLPEA